MNRRCWGVAIVMKVLLVIGIAIIQFKRPGRRWRRNLFNDSRYLGDEPNSFEYSETIFEQSSEDSYKNIDEILKNKPFIDPMNLLNGENNNNLQGELDTTKSSEDFYKRFNKILNETEKNEYAMQSGIPVIDENGIDTATSCIPAGDAAGVYTMKSPEFKAFEVFCDNGWTLIQQRINKSKSFDPNWDNYEEGFGSFDGDFFLGLEKIYWLTKANPHELYISLDFQNGTRKLANYDHFEIANIRDGYHFVNLGALSGNVTNDVLRDFRGPKVSAKDCGWCNLSDQKYKDVVKGKMLMRPKNV